jgi:hypothetical protein
MYKIKSILKKTKIKTKNINDILLEEFEKIDNYYY